MDQKHTKKPHQILVHLIEACGINTSKSSNVADVYIRVTVGPKSRLSKSTKIRPRIVSTVFNETYVFENVMLSSAEMETEKLQIWVYDREIFTSNALIGSCELSLRNIYARESHQYKKCWLALRKPETPGQQRGFLRITTHVLGPNDPSPPNDGKISDPVQLDDGNEDDLILGEPSISTSLHLLYVYIYRGEGLRSLRSNTINPFISVRFNGSTVQTSNFGNNANPFVNSRAEVPYALPLFSNSIQIQLWNSRFGLPASLLGSKTLKFENKVGVSREPSWVNFYSYSDDPVTNTVGKVASLLDGDAGPGRERTASEFVGRLYVRISSKLLRDTQNPHPRVLPTAPAPEKPTRRFTLQAFIFSVSQLPVKGGRTFVKASLFTEDAQTKDVMGKDGNYRWMQRLRLSCHLPLDLRQAPNLIFSVYSQAGIGKRKIAHISIPITDLVPIRDIINYEINKHFYLNGEKSTDALARQGMVPKVYHLYRTTVAKHLKFDPKEMIHRYGEDDVQFNHGSLSVAIAFGLKSNETKFINDIKSMVVPVIEQIRKDRALSPSKVRKEREKAGLKPTEPPERLQLPRLPLQLRMHLYQGVNLPASDNGALNATLVIRFGKTQILKSSEIRGTRYPLWFQHLESDEKSTIQLASTPSIHLLLYHNGTELMARTEIDIATLQELHQPSYPPNVPPRLFRIPLTRVAGRNPNPRKPAVKKDMGVPVEKGGVFGEQKEAGRMKGVEGFDETAYIVARICVINVVDERKKQRGMYGYSMTPEDEKKHQQRRIEEGFRGAFATERDIDAKLRRKVAAIRIDCLTVRGILPHLFNGGLGSALASAFGDPGNTNMKLQISVAPFTMLHSATRVTSAQPETLPIPDEPQVDPPQILALPLTQGACLLVKYIRLDGIPLPTYGLECIAISFKLFHGSSLLSVTEIPLSHFISGPRRQLPVYTGAVEQSRKGKRKGVLDINTAPLQPLSDLFLDKMLKELRDEEAEDEKERKEEKQNQEIADMKEHVFLKHIFGGNRSQRYQPIDLDDHEDHIIELDLFRANVTSQRVGLDSAYMEGVRAKTDSKNGDQSSDFDEEKLTSQANKAYGGQIHRPGVPKLDPIEIIHLFSPHPPADPSLAPMLRCSFRMAPSLDALVTQVGARSLVDLRPKYSHDYVCRLYIYRALNLSTHGRRHFKLQPLLRLSGISRQGPVVREIISSDGGRNPNFYQVVELDVRIPHGSIVKLSVFDKSILGNIGHRLIGEGFVDIERLVVAGRTAGTKKIINLRNPEYGTSQGVIEVETHVLEKSKASQIVPRKFAPPVLKDYQLRLVIWETSEVRHPEPHREEEVVDQKIRVTVNFGATDNTLVEKFTDTAWYAVHGSAEWNYRMVWDTRIPAPNPRIQITLFDDSILGTEDMIGEVTFNLERLFDKAIRNNVETHETHWLSLNNPNYPNDDVGRVRVQFNLLTKAEADERHVGEAQNEPNRDPFLPNPKRAPPPWALYSRAVEYFEQRKAFFIRLAVLSVILVLLIPILYIVVVTN
ncbi:hypothetical protein AAMO2058_001422700 [Amorphochlora amoebiformis]